MLHTMGSYWRHFEADRCFLLPWKQNLETSLMWKITWSVHYDVLSLEYLCFELSNRAANSWYFRREQNECNVMLYLTTKHINWKFRPGPISNLHPWLQPCFLTTNRLSLRIDCSEGCVLKVVLISAMCNVQQLSQSRSCTVDGPRTLVFFH